jgi:hypothetical protein
MKHVLACFCFALCAALISTPTNAERSSVRSVGKVSVVKTHASPVSKKPKKVKSPTKKRKSPGFARLLTAKQRMTIAAYEACVRGGAEGARKDEKLFRALDRAFAAQEENPLRGSPDKLGTEICVAELLGFGNFKTDQDVFLAIQAGELWDLSFSGIIFPPELPLLRRVGRAGTVAYMNELLVAMRDAFPDEEPPILRIPSIVRTVDGQQRLASAGRSPARCDVKGLCSVHTSGGAIDISLRTLNRKQFAWLYERLLRDISDRKVLAILERRGGHFHVFVLPLEITLAYHQSRQVLRAQR